MIDHRQALTTVLHDGVAFVEGSPGAPLLAAADDMMTILEACLSARSRCALLYAENLPPAFFDLSSQVAGSMLQKLRNYGLRLAIVRGPRTAAASHRFSEMGVEDQRGTGFAVFGDRDAAIAWLRS